MSSQIYLRGLGRVRSTRTGGEFSKKNVCYLARHRTKIAVQKEYCEIFGSIVSALIAPGNRIRLN